MAISWCCFHQQMAHKPNWAWCKGINWPPRWASSKAPIWHHLWRLGCPGALPISYSYRIKMGHHWSCFEAVFCLKTGLRLKPLYRLALRVGDILWPGRPQRDDLRV